MHLKTNDIVEVIAGDDRGQRGKILKIDREEGKVVVEGMNRVYKHVRRSQKNPQGGRLNKEMPIRISNVLLFCSRCNSATRTGSAAAENWRHWARRVQSPGSPAGQWPVVRER